MVQKVKASSKQQFSKKKPFVDEKGKVRMARLVQAARYSNSNNHSLRKLDTTTLGVDELQKQKIRLGFTPVSQESAATLGKGSPKRDKSLKNIF